MAPKATAVSVKLGKVRATGIRPPSSQMASTSAIDPARSSQVRAPLWRGSGTGPLLRILLGPTNRAIPRTKRRPGVTATDKSGTLPPERPAARATAPYIGTARLPAGRGTPAAGGARPPPVTAATPSGSVRAPADALECLLGRREVPEVLDVQGLGITLHLADQAVELEVGPRRLLAAAVGGEDALLCRLLVVRDDLDRKSTRLNSSHLVI